MIKRRSTVLFEKLKQDIENEAEKSTQTAFSQMAKGQPQPSAQSLWAARGTAVSAKRQPQNVKRRVAAFAEQAPSVSPSVIRSTNSVAESLAPQNDFSWESLRVPQSQSRLLPYPSASSTERRPPLAHKSQQETPKPNRPQAYAVSQESPFTILQNIDTTPSAPYNESEEDMFDLFFGDKAERYRRIAQQFETPSASAAEILSGKNSLPQIFQHKATAPKAEVQQDSFLQTLGKNALAGLEHLAQQEIAQQRFQVEQAQATGETLVHFSKNAGAVPFEGYLKLLGTQVGFKRSIPAHLTANMQYNYDHNISGRMIHGQGVDPVKNLYHGVNSCENGGCGAIGLYNAITLLQKKDLDRALLQTTDKASVYETYDESKVTFADIEQNVVRRGALVFDGSWGTTPYVGPAILKEYGYTAIQHDTPETLSNAMKNGDVAVITVWNWTQENFFSGKDETTVMGGFHTYAIVKNGDTIWAYNLENKSVDKEEISLSDVAERFIVGYEIH